jgi:uncharacterized protein
MRKRLRKKKHIGEFQEFGVEISATLRDDVDFIEFLDDFLGSAVEAHGLAFGGGGQTPRLEGYLELGRRDVVEPNLAAVSKWLSADARVLAIDVGEPEDAWYPKSGDD